jgi:hypothetical protein
MSSKNAIGDASLNSNSQMNVRGKFNPADPFPLFDIEEISYREAQSHAFETDTYLGLRTIEIEASLDGGKSDQELWIGLPVQALMTPYTELRQILDRLKPQPGQLIIDCGAAYGRMGFVMGEHFPEVNFLGFEIVPERVEEGQRCLALRHCNSAKLICTNIDDPSFEMPEADVYFVYDFSFRKSIDRLLERLQKIALKRKITVVARGRASRDAVDYERPWLSKVVPPEHFPNFSIYRS